MSMELPEDLQSLEANSGIYAIWMIFQHYGIDLHIPDLVQLTCHDSEIGTSSIALAVTLKTLGLDITFYTEVDLDKQPQEVAFYGRAHTLKIPVIETPLTYEQIQGNVDAGRFVIVFYDTLEGIGNHSLIYEITDNEVSFFDSFESMPKAVFEQQRRVEGICQQAIVIDDRSFVMRQS